MTLAINDLKRHNQPLETALQAAMARVLDRGYYILGPECTAFEHEFSSFLGTSWAVGVGNGTDALELALRALGVQSGNYVATVANAGMYAGTAIRAVGAVPCYVDVLPGSLLIDPSALSRVLDSSQVRALVVTHLYGRMVDMAAILEVTRAYGVPVIEDCAQAHGASRLGRRAGSWGDLATFSFYPTKNLGALGDGGMVVGGDESLHARLLSLRQYGWVAKYKSDYRGGRNSRLDEIQAAVLRAKLPFLDGWNARRRQIVRRYRAELDGLGWGLPPYPDEADVVHLCVLEVERRAAVQAALVDQGVGCDVHYPIPDHRQLAYTDGVNITLPVTEAACTRVLTLPCFPEMLDAEVDLVVQACSRAVQSLRGKL
ncbi:DegT/DnrJ/EryC1/StrS family aminotransferase [Castellaniella caeni]|uniref:DegT/DnrJ/EryC1/StrS family aminotransferase n=1 Tax=Castellaniella caeni TaxID=266123 RepID=UPI0009FD6A28|nr:DegT/DnrJ/EryC1/StrS family aminotransferase [Castellaniella caeni]